ncbi:MAG TPA: hypothetical protein VLU99_01045 [Nitrososphaerales archaeon]|nr:hypothetical protein [Nitrososphaerales archaeon]HUK74347.1 hypothetical protein [Nitrososphaerales archaeon]
MRSLVVVATTLSGSVDRFGQSSLQGARNLKDFLAQTREYRAVSIYELENSYGPMSQWSELEEGQR